MIGKVRSLNVSGVLNRQIWIQYNNFLLWQDMIERHDCAADTYVEIMWGNHGTMSVSKENFQHVVASMPPRKETVWRTNADPTQYCYSVPNKVLCLKCVNKATDYWHLWEKTMCQLTFKWQNKAAKLMLKCTSKVMWGSEHFRANYEVFFLKMLLNLVSWWSSTTGAIVSLTVYSWPICNHTVNMWSNQFKGQSRADHLTMV